MRLRLKAFVLHLLGSATVLTLILTGLYLGWYRWPGWYLTGAAKIALILAGVDVVLGPIVTFLIASPSKPRRELARDITCIVLVQLAAMGYGATTLWKGRPLYYAFSIDRLELVQASDLSAEDVALARQHNPDLAPYWYSLPRFVWAPLPDDPKVRDEILRTAVFGGKDVIQMPRYFKPWSQGVPELRAALKTPDRLPPLVTRAQKEAAKARLGEFGIPADHPVTLLMTGHGLALVTVFDDRSSVKAVLGPS
jgi:hypothetical protein